VAGVSVMHRSSAWRHGDDGMVSVCMCDLAFDLIV
jgi:hypothetical protein